jgi:hypothetical protein
MHPIIQKTFLGLSSACYGRHFFFSCIILGLFILVGVSGASVNPANWLWFFLNTFLYPYARFAYESGVDFIFGKNVFIVNAVLFMGIKIVTMMMCWMGAIFFAPLGLAYLYLHHSGKLR